MYPYIILFGKTIPSYGLCMAVGILLAAVLSARQAKRQGIPFEDVIILAASAVGSALIFAKLLYIIVTYPSEVVWRRLAALDVTLISEGGIVFYGGLLGGIIGALFGAMLIRRPLLSFESAVVPYLPLGHAVGRIGCTLAGCCYGMEYEGFGALHYQILLNGLPSNHGCFPVQPAEAVGDVLICLALLRMTKTNCRKGVLLTAYLSMYAALRFVLEFFRGDTARGMWLGMSTSQWISVALLIVCAAVSITRSK